MAKAEIRYFAGLRKEDLSIERAEQIAEPEIFEGPTAIRDGHKRFKEIMDKNERSAWLLHILIKRDFDNHMTIDFTLRIGPEPFWSDEYLKENGLGRYAFDKTSKQ